MTAGVGGATQPRYKPTDVGDIPEEWVIAPLGEAGRWLSGGTPSLANDQYWNGDIPWVSAKDMKLSRLSDSILHITELAVGNGTRLAPVGAILLVVRGMILAHTLPVALALRRVAFNQDLKVLVPRNGVHSEFILFWLLANSQRVLGIASESTHGTKRLASSDLFALPVALPPLHEQLAIATALTDVDALLDALDLLIAKKRDLKQAAMQQLLTGQTRLPGYVADWGTRRLGDIADIDPENLPGNTPGDFRFNYISLEDVDCGTLVGHSEQHFRSAPSRARRTLRQGDVLVSTVRPNLKSHLHFQIEKPNWVCSTGFAVVRCRAGIANPGFVFPHFFGHLLSRQIETLLTGSNYPAINSKDVRELEIPVPTHAEQTAIAEVFIDMDTELATMESRRTKTRALKQAMMQELLTGRTRLV